MSPRGRSKASTSHSKSTSSYVWSLIVRNAFVISAGIIFFNLLWNTTTLVLQRFWGVSGDVWDYIVDTYGVDSFTLLVTGTSIVLASVYFTVGLLYTVMDATGRPKFLRRYKVQPGTNESVNRKALSKMNFILAINTVLTYLFIRVIFLNLMEARGYDRSSKLPSNKWTLFEVILCTLVMEIAFYYTHRLFHHRLLYKHFHKIHHEWQAPIAMVTAYAHPFEHIIANSIPVFLGPLILGSHPSTVWLWSAVITLSSLNDHSGYHFPFYTSSEFHDYHHLKFTECYGSIGFLDLLHGTDKNFRETIFCLRHVTLFSLSPAQDIYPAGPSKKIKAN